MKRTCIAAQRPTFGRRQTGRLSAIDEALQRAHGAPLRALNNKRNPLDEAVYIILSLQTDIPRLRQTWRSLKRSFPTWGQAQEASIDALSGAIRTGGLHNQKARALKSLLAEVMARFGKLSLDSLRASSTEEAERELTRLPGLSWKAARCVLYSLDRDVFPVDTNTFRIMKRAGILSQGTIYRRRALQDALQDAVPPNRRKALHVNLMLHGRRICTPLRPRCTDCPMSHLCPRRGVARNKVTHAD